MFASYPLVLLALASSTFATVFITSPVESTTFAAGQSATISWQESADSAPPTLAQFGPSKISIYTGNAQQQTSLQLISDSVDVGSTSSIPFTPDASIGPTGNNYFVRIESLALKDATSPQFPALAFSAKFTLSGMTGTFSSAIQAQIDGQSTAPIVGQTTVSGSSSQTSGTTATPTTSSASHSSSAASTAKNAVATSAAANGAMPVAVGNVKVWMGVLAGVVAGVVMF